MDTSTAFRLGLVDDAIAANQDPADAPHLARLAEYRAKLVAGHGDVSRPSRDVGELAQPPRGTGGTKATSGQPAAKATGPQRGFIEKLLGERATADVPWHFQNLLGKFASETLSKSDASELIDWLNGQPRKTGPQGQATQRPASERQLGMVNARRALVGLRPLAASELFADEVDEELAQIAAMPLVAVQTTAAAEEGMYRKDGVIYKVQIAHHGSGRPYAKKLVQDEGGEWFFDRAPGMVNRLTPADKLSLEEAKQFGQLYGFCCACATILTDEKSIAEGVGPICAKRF